MYDTVKAIVFRSIVGHGRVPLMGGISDAVPAPMAEEFRAGVEEHSIPALSCSLFAHEPRKLIMSTRSEHCSAVFDMSLIK